MRLTDDLLAFPWEGFDNNCNVFYFGGDVRVLIDVGHLRFTEDLLNRLNAECVGPPELRMVIATHSHPDHLEGIMRFTDLGVPLGMHPAAVRYMEDYGDLIYQFLGSDMPELTVSHLLEEGPVGALAGAIEVYSTPGHEPGSLCVHWPEKKALAVGDLVFAGGCGRTDFPGGDHAEIRKQIARMAELDVEYLMPGHGPVLEGKARIAANFEDVLRMLG